MICIQMNCKKIVVLSWQNYDARIETLFAIKELLSNNIKVEYWDVTEITIPGNKVALYPLTKGMEERIIKNKRDLIRALASMDINNTLFVPYMNYCKFTSDCYRILNQFHCEIAYCVNGCFPEAKRSNKKELIKGLHLKKIFKKLLNYINWKIGSAKLKLLSISMRPFKYLLKTCGDAIYLNDGITDANTQIIDFNSSDYQNAISSDKNSEFLDEANNYIVFIDQFIPFHPDRDVFKLKPLDSLNYFEELNRFFSEVEKKYGKKVVVAGHPAATEIYNENDYFKGRSVYYGKTMELIKYSFGVISHYSTAISYAVIYNKPIIFYFTSEMKYNNEAAYRTGIHMSEVLKSPFLCSESPYSLPSELLVSQKNYQHYKYSYLTNASSEKISNGKILMNLLYS